MEHELVHLSHRNIVHLFETSIGFRKNHFHRVQELFLVLTGSVSVLCGGNSYELCEGDFLLLGKNRAHTLRSKQRNMLLVAQFNLDMLNVWFPQRSAFQKHCCKIARDESDPLWQSFRSNLLTIAAHQARESRFSSLVSFHALCSMLLSCVRALPLEEEDAAQSGRPASEMDKRLERILDWMNENYTRGITLQELAHREQLNPYYLSHYIKEHLGFSFTQHLTELRTAHAVQLLESTDMKTIDILLSSGFSDYRYMRKAFMERYGCTPKEYRDALRAEEPLYSHGGADMIEPGHARFSAEIQRFCPDFPACFLQE